VHNNIPGKLPVLTHLHCQARTTGISSQDWPIKMSTGWPWIH